MAHLTVAVSEAALRTSVDLLVGAVKWEKQGLKDMGAFSAGYHVKGHLEGGAVDLRADGSISVKELDVKWDKLQVTLGLDIPEICVGGGCINLPWPLPDICLPRVCVFSRDPDISISPDFAAFVAQEISFTGRVLVRYFDASSPPPPGFDPCGFLRNVLSGTGVIPPLPTSNQWHVHVDPQSIDIELFGRCVPIYRIDDPFELLPAKLSHDVLLSGAPVMLVPVKVPVKDLAVTVDDVELVLQAEVGA